MFKIRVNYVFFCYYFFRMHSKILKDPILYYYYCRVKCCNYVYFHIQPFIGNETMSTGFTE